MSPLRRLALAAAVAVVGGGAILGVTEAALRGAGVEPRGYVVVDEETCYFGWAASTHDVMGKRGSKLVHRLWTDPEGFRTADGHAAPEGAKCRVLAVGDSFTHGTFVDADEAFPAVLGRAARALGYSVEVDNGGMPGHTIAEERAAALGRWGHLPARVVMLTHTANDLEDLILMKRRGCRLGGPAPEAAQLQPALSNGVQDLRVLKLSQEVAMRIKVLTPRMRSLRNGPQELSPPPSAEECAAAGETYLDLALDLAEALGKKGTKLLVVFAENFVCAGARQPTLQAEFTRRLQDAGARIVNAWSALYEPDASLRPEDGHPSPKGHRLLADQIGASLFASGWLDDCR